MSFPRHCSDKEAIMTTVQRKYTILSAIFAALGLVSIVICIVSLSSLDFGTDGIDTSTGAMSIIGVLVLGFVTLISASFIIFIGSFFLGGFALASYKCATLAIKADVERKHPLPHVLCVLAGLELTVAALAVLYLIAMIVYTCLW